MPLQATSGAASYDAFGGGVPVVPNYIEEVFSTYLYTGNSTSGGTQSITNSIDLSTKGGLVWIKGRSALSDHILTDTTRGAGTTASNNQALSSNLTTAEDLGASYDFLSAFNTTGFAVTQGGSTAATRGTNYNNVTYASWTFRKQPKFFDVVTYTGDGTSPRAISHNLGSAPAFMIIKRTDAVANWIAYHISLGADKFMRLNTTDAAVTNPTTIWANTSPTSTVFTVGTDTSLNASGGTYVAYLFAHDAGGFGLTGTDNVISCGSYTGNGSGEGPVVTLGYEPQWIMIKPTTLADNWTIVDNFRAMVKNGQSDAKLFPNSIVAETNTSAMEQTATGFQIKSISAEYNTNGATYIYVAIRRGPMKVPTDATTVFQPVTYTGTNVDNRLVNTGIVTDMTMARIRTATSTGGFYTANRLLGSASLGTAITAELNTDSDSFMTPTVGYGNSFSAMNGFGVGNDVIRQLNQSSTSQLAYAFARAPSFFDVVCYTGTGVARTVAHNLAAVPELMIVKARNDNSNWGVYNATSGPTRWIKLQSNSGLEPLTTPSIWNDTEPTASVFSLAGSSATDYTTVNDGAGINYVAYLFSTCAGVSKVGSYTGNGSTQTIDCGFTAGARFVLIKRTDDVGDWYVWDTARGIISGNDPYLLLNSTAAEVTSTDYIDTYSAGFEISSSAPAAINASGGTFIFLAIA